MLANPDWRVVTTAFLVRIPNNQMYLKVGFGNFCLEFMENSQGLLDNNRYNAAPDVGGGIPTI